MRACPGHRPRRHGCRLRGVGAARSRPRPGVRAVRSWVACEHMFDTIRPCSCRSTRPIGSWSSCEARRGPVPAEEAARSLFALAQRADRDRALAARRRRHAATRGSPGAARPSGSPRRPGATSSLERARSSSSTSRRPGSRPARRGSARSAPQRVARARARRRRSRRSSIRARRSRRRSRRSPASTGRRCAARRGPSWRCGASSRSRVTRVLVAHNARFDLAFLDREVERLTGRRVAAPVVDTVWLARRLLGEPLAPRRPRRRSRTSSASRREPCHRALPDARGDGRDPASR